MSAFGGEADMTVCGRLLSRSLLGVKRTWPFAAHMSAFDPKRTLSRLLTDLVWAATMPVLNLGDRLEAARSHYTSWRCRGRMVANRTWAAGRADAARRRTRVPSRGRSGRASPGRGVRADFAVIGLDHRP